MSAISVVIPTYQGASRIVQTLRCLERQTFKDFEVVVVIDGSTDNTENEMLKAKLNLALGIVNQSNKGRSGARNAGVKSTRGAYVVFFDDDVVVPESLLEKYYTKSLESPDIIAGTFYQVYDHQNEFVRYAGYLNEKWNSGIPSGENKTPYLSAGNCMIRKSVFESLSGFDERLTDAEDLDFAIRAFEKNFSIQFDKDIAVGHRHQTSFTAYSKRLKQYQKAGDDLNSINPDASKYISRGPQTARRLKMILYRIFSADVFIKLMDKGFFVFIPVKLKFRIYDFLLTANAYFAK